MARTRHCPHCQKPGPFFHRLETLTRIKVAFKDDGSFEIAEDAEAEELDASSDGFECGSCGARFQRPSLLTN